MSSNQNNADDDMKAEYTVSNRQGVRGKYYQRLREGYSITIDQPDGTAVVQKVLRPEGTVTLDPDVREYFPDAESVNSALRALIQLIPAKKHRLSGH